MTQETKKMPDPDEDRPLFSTCCGAEPRDILAIDYGFCPTCHEHCVFEYDEEHDCNVSQDDGCDNKSHPHDEEFL